MPQIKAALLPNGRQQFVDQNGAPLVGGTVAFFIPATTTPKDTWQDPYQLALNTNPVVLDSLGSAAIYGAGQYREIVYDALGNEIWDAMTDGYPVNPANFGLQTSIASAGTTDIGTITTNNVLITGTTSITSFGGSASINTPIYLVQFQGVITLTNSASLDLPGSGNLTTAAGDCALMMYKGSSNWLMVGYFPNVGYPQFGQMNTWTGGQFFTGSIDSTVAYTTTTALHTNSIGYLGTPFNTQNVDYTLILSDSGKTIYHASGSPHTWTIPQNASVAFPIGTVINLRNNGAGSVSIATSGSATLALAGSSSTGTRTLSNHGAAAIVKETTDGWYITGIVT